MAARQLPGQLQTSAVPQARLEEWYNFKQEQDNTRAEFEQRVAEARRKLLERHANEQQAFWTGQPCAAWQPVANGQTATLPSQVNATSSGPQRVVGQPAVSGSRGPAQNSVPTTLGQPKAPAHAPKRNPAVNHGALDQPNVPANAPKKGPKAVPPAATRDAGMARSQVKPATKAQPSSAPKTRNQTDFKQRAFEVIDLCEDEDVEPQPRPVTQSNSLPAASTQQVEFNPRLPSAVITFFGNSSKVSRPTVKDEESLEGQQTQLHETEVQVSLNKASAPLASPRNPLLRPLQRQQKAALANATLHSDKTQHRAPGFGKASERLEEDVDMKEAPAETKPPELGSRPTARTQKRFSELPRGQQDEPRGTEVHKSLASDMNIEKGRTLFFGAPRNPRGAQPAERTTKVQPTQMQENTARLGLSAQPLDVSTVISRCEPEYMTKVQDDRSAVKGSQLETLLPDQVSARGFPSSHGPPSPQMPSNPLASTHFKIPEMPSRPTSTNERTWRENTITSRASSQTLPGNSVAYADKARPNRLPLPTPPLSQVSQTRKRKVQHNVSEDSDDGSEFEPSSDDEPLINLVRRRQELEAKKAKYTNSPVSAKSVSGTPKFGSKLSKANRPITPAKPTGKTAAPRTPTLSARSQDSDRALGSESPSVLAANRTSSRRAKQKARAALDEHFQKYFEFHNEEDIREAEEREHRHKGFIPTTTESGLRDRLQRMSITPAPDSARPAPDRMETAGAYDADDKTVQTKRKDSAYSLAQWTNARMRGDRQLLKTQSVSSRGRGDEENESELDLSAYQYVKGRIVQRVEEVDMTGELR